MTYADFRRSTTTAATTTSAAAAAMSKGATVLDASGLGWAWAAVVDSRDDGAGLGAVLDGGVIAGASLIRSVRST